VSVFDWVLTSRIPRVNKKGAKVVNGVKILLDVAKESSDWFPPLKYALGGVDALIKHYEVVRSFRVAPTHNLRSHRNAKTSGRRPASSFHC